MNYSFRAIELKALMNQTIAVMQGLDARKDAMLIENALRLDGGQALVHTPAEFELIAEAFVECSQSLRDIAAEAKKLHKMEHQDD